MPNRFFINLIDLVAGTRARAGDVEANFSQVEAGFEEVAGEIDALVAGKADIAGEAYTGTHDFSAASMVILPGGTNINDVSASEILALDGITGNIQAQIDALVSGKANKAGETYTGLHNFLGSTINVPTAGAGQSGNRAASLDFVNAVAFAPALPGQTGKAGQFLTTDGVNASFQSLNGKIFFLGAN